MLAATDLNLMIATIFFQGAVTSIRINVGFLYFMEFMPEHAQTCFGTAFGLVDASTYMLATVYFSQISKNWLYFALIGYFWNVISAFGAWFLPESPRYLCELGRMYELERSLKTIAKINGKTLDF